VYDAEAERQEGENAREERLGGRKEPSEGGREEGVGSW